MKLTDRLKEGLQFQLVSVRKIAGPTNTVLLIATLSTTLANLVEWRGWDPKTTTLLIGTGTALLVLAAANLWTRAFKLHREEQKTNARLNPYLVNTFTPWEAATWTNAHLPRMRALRDLCAAQGLDERANELASRVDAIEQWADAGYLPPGAFPEGFETYLREQEDERL